MEEEIDPPKEYVDAFNLGYELNKCAPEIAELLSGLKENSQTINGIRAGIIEYSTEQVPSRIPDWLLKDRFTETDKEITSKLDKDKGIEPER